MKIKRKKSWNEKVEEVSNCYERCKDAPNLSSTFYDNLFFLDPSLKSKFAKTDWKHQKKAFTHALFDVISYLKDPRSDHYRKQITRLARTHSHQNLDIHPHSYYYWIDAVVLTLKSIDKRWEKDLEFYLRECLFYPISFMISLYHHKE